MAPLVTSALGMAELGSIDIEPVAGERQLDRERLLVAAVPTSRLFGRYPYRTSHRIIEIVAMFACMVVGSLFAWRTMTELGSRWGGGTAFSGPALRSPAS